LAIVLHGLTGPVKIGDKVYKKPEVSGEMPAFGQNDQLSDQDIAQILSFIRNAWNNQADTVNQADVQQARQTNKGRQNPFTLEELK
jgi:mono/diheme cytochrome c family protein